LPMIPFDDIRRIHDPTHLHWVAVKRRKLCPVLSPGAYRQGILYSGPKKLDTR